ncbi:MAG: peptidylprolyl isomerase [Bacilli bacterium]|nr:peptidylprolyl isomerase [Bacilli bacterium]
MKGIKELLIIIVCALSCVFIINYEYKEEINFDIKGNEIKLSYNTKNPIVAIDIDKYGYVVLELYPDIAPNTVNNFVNLILDGFYDNNSFHRLVPGFVLQGGDPNGNGTGGPGYSIKGEFTRNGFKNTLKHTEGIISMARAKGYNSAGSQFFIMLGNAETLDNKYAAFGKVIEGMDVLRKIEKTETVLDSETGKLKNNITINKIVVDVNDTKISDTIKLEY